MGQRRLERVRASSRNRAQPGHLGLQSRNPALQRADPRGGVLIPAREATSPAVTPSSSAKAATSSAESSLWSLNASASSASAIPAAAAITRRESPRSPRRASNHSASKNRATASPAGWRRSCLTLIKPFDHGLSHDAIRLPLYRRRRRGLDLHGAHLSLPTPSGIRQPAAVRPAIIPAQGDTEM